MKKFIREEIPKLDRVDVKYIPGLSPRIVFFNDEERAEVVDIAKMTTEDIVQLCLDRGFAYL